MNWKDEMKYTAPEWTLADAINDFFENEGTSGEAKDIHYNEEGDVLEVSWIENGDEWHTNIKCHHGIRREYTTEELFEQWEADRMEMLPEIYYTEDEEE